MAKCKCQNCQEVGSTDKFFRVITKNDKNSYYCTEDCYKSMNRITKLKIECKYLMIDIVGKEFHFGKSVEQYVNKRIQEYVLRGQLEALYFTLYYKRLDICKFLSYKNFTNAIAKCAYAFAMIDNDVANEQKRLTDHEKNTKRVTSMEAVPEVRKVKKGKDISGLI